MQVEDETAPREARIVWCSPVQARELAQANAALKPELDLSGFVPPEAGADAGTYTRAAADPDAELLSLLEEGPKSHQALAQATGATLDACRPRLARLADQGQVEHEVGSSVWALAS